MLKVFGPKLPRRTSAKSFDDLVLDEGRSRVLFNVDSTSTRTSKFLVTNHLPPAPKPPSDPDTPNSSLCPPFHIHLKENETFHVISGRAKFLLLDYKGQLSETKGSEVHDGCTRRIVSPGEVITIPRGQIHTFRNASSTDQLVLEFGFSHPGLREADQLLNAKMKHFFLNTQRYRSDCASQGVPRALTQVLLFNHHADVALVPGWLLTIHKNFPWLRGFIEGYLATLVGRVMNLVGGVILGRWLFGLRSAYEEYSGGALINHGRRTADVAADNSKNSDIEDTKGHASGADLDDERLLNDRRSRSNAPDWACQAWRDHSFDGQSDSWRT